MTETATKPVILCILDGWGSREDAENNAIVQANTPTWDRLTAENPTGHLDASELEVGLPSGQMGNSEVGHMNLGAGRVVMQELPRIDQAVAENTLVDTDALQALITALKDSGGTCHLMGLMSPGGVHSHQDHMAALVKTLDEAGISVAVHAFLDGRDTPPKSALGFLEKFSADIADCSRSAIATVAGRYYAMDRDKRWDRVQKAYNALTTGAGEGGSFETAAAAVDAAYAAELTDEFVLPSIIGGFTGMKDGDAILMANFRADRAREILSALADPVFDGFERTAPVSFCAVTGMVQYSSAHTAYMTALFPPQELHNILGAVVADAGLKQLRIAETEKYAHVTFFFNGGREEEFDGEDRILIPSPDVATYDLKPEMSAIEVTDALVDDIENGRHELIVVNFANTDMVGHTGVLTAAIKAVETVDACLARLDAAVTSAGGAMLITADHGNAEQMADSSSGQPHTAHTLNRVPLILTGRPGVSLHDGRLADVAPTLLHLLGLPRPADMTGRPLIDLAEDHDRLRASA